MATLENVSVEDLRQILAEVDDADATKRLMAAITYKEIDDLTQAEAAALYGFSSSWASKWFTRLERLAIPPDLPPLVGQVFSSDNPMSRRLCR